MPCCTFCWQFRLYKKKNVYIEEKLGSTSFMTIYFFKSLGKQHFYFLLENSNHAC